MWELTKSLNSHKWRWFENQNFRNMKKSYLSAWAIKLLTTRPSSMFIRGPYVLKILAIRISVIKAKHESTNCMKTWWVNFSKAMKTWWRCKLNMQTVKENHLFRAAYDSQTLKSLPHASPHHSNSWPLKYRKKKIFLFQNSYHIRWVISKRPVALLGIYNKLFENETVE